MNSFSLVIITLAYLNLAGSIDYDSVASHYGKEVVQSDSLLESAPQVELKIKLIARPNPVGIDYDRLFVGDIFNCEGLKVACMRLSALDIGPAPEPGRKLRVISDDLIQKIESFKVGFYRFEFDVPHAIYLKANHQVIVRSDIMSEVKKIAEDIEINESTKLIVDRLTLLSPPKLRPGQVSYDLTALRQKLIDISSQKSLNRNIFINNFEMKIVTVKKGFSNTKNLVFSLTIKPMRHVYRAKKSIARGTPLREEYFVREWVDAKQDPIVDIKPLLGRKLASRIRQGRYLLSRDVVELPLISRGDEVNVIIISAGMQVRQKGKALNKAMRGDTVRVRLENRKSINGIAVSQKLVRVN